MNFGWWWRQPIIKWSNANFYTTGLDDFVYALTIWIDVGRLVTNGRGLYHKWISVGGDTNR